MPEVSASRYLVNAGWDDVPHLDAKTKAEMLSSTMPHLRAARSKGEPSLGAGAIYPIAFSDISCEPFSIPAYWPRCYSLDVGWKRTAALWGAYDRTADTWYMYTEHYRGQAEPSTHATAIKARGDWIPGVIDPAARGRSQKDGERLIITYGELGLHLTPAINAVESGLYDTWMRLETGRLKVFKTLGNFKAEYMLYRRDEKGEIVKQNDHLMDDMRYIVTTGLSVAKPVPFLNASQLSSSIGGDPAVGI